MPSYHPGRRVFRLLSAAAVVTGLTLGTGALAYPAQASTSATVNPVKKKKFVVPPAKSWVGGQNLISARELTDLPAGVPLPPAPKSASWLVADLDSREILAAKNVHSPLLPASTLKLFTALAIAPTLDPKQVYTGTTADENIDGTRVGIVAGSKYTVNDLLHGLIMVSGNDTANALGNLAGGQTAAIAMMRQEAQKLGAFDTVVRNTSGLDAKGQVSSAYDLALAGSEALKNPELAKIMVTPTYSFPSRGKTLGAKRKHYQTQNHNRLLGYLPGMIGVKNGYTTHALGTNVSAATYQGHRYIVVLMHTEGTIYTPSGDLLKWAFKYGQKANPVGTLVKPGELTAMNGPGILTPTPSPAPTLSAAKPGAQAASALSASASVSPENPMIRFWPVAAVGVLLLGGVIFGLRPVLAGTRRARMRKLKDRQRRSRHRY